jgi:hypothetical protein
MKYDASEIKQWIADGAAVFFHRDDPPRAFTIEQNGAVLTITAAFPSEERRIVVKAVLSKGNVGGPAQLVQIQKAIVACDPGMDVNMPQLLGCDAQNRWIAMEYIPGPTLLDLMKKSLRGSDESRAACDRSVQQAAVILARFHRLTPEQVGLDKPARANESFRRCLATACAKLPAQRYLHGSRPAIEQFCNRLPAAFSERRGLRLFPVDAQPKNVIVPGFAQACFIDLSFSIGHPAMSAGLFLAAFDRLQVQRFGSGAGSIIEAWKQSFASAYLREVEPWVAEDLPFFYLWGLIYTMRDNLRRRPFLAPYLGRRYAARINRFLELAGRSAPHPLCAEAWS